MGKQHGRQHGKRLKGKKRKPRKGKAKRVTSITGMAKGTTDRKTTHAQLNAEEVADRMGWPTAKWAGHCYGVAVEMLRQRIVEGEPRYGAYKGPVDDQCQVGSFVNQHHGMGSVRHGWIEQRDGTIIDPTRWCFLGWRTAHIFVIPPDDERQADYDVAAQGMAHMLLGMRETPTRDSAADPRQLVEIDLGLSDECMDHLRCLLDDTDPAPLTWGQWHWVGNLPIDLLEPYAREVYEAMKGCTEHHLGALIPQDHYDHVMNLWSEDV